MENKFIIGLDVGERRIGVAIASTAARIPSAHSYIDRQKQPDHLAAIQDIIGDKPVEAIVVGLPRDMSGNETAQTKVARAFADELSARVSLPVVLQDEAATSLLAEERLGQRGKPYSKGDIDAEAAAIILQDYLNLSVGQTA